MLPPTKDAALVASFSRGRRLCEELGDLILKGILRRSRTRRYPVLDNHLHTGSFAPDFATSSASHLAIASFSGLSASGGVASRRMFRQLGGRGDRTP